MAGESANTPVGIELQAILEGISRLDTEALESFANRVNEMVARRKAPFIPKREAELIRKINEGLPSAIQSRYLLLFERLQEEVLTPEEHEELSALIPIVEAKDVERLTYLVELAMLRGKTVDEVMDQLGIKGPSDVN